MGMYIYLLDWDLPRLQQVTDVHLNTVFQEARELCPSLLISETGYRTSSWFGKSRIYYTYTVYHKSPDVMQVRQITSAGNTKETIIPYLYGIMNGVLAERNKH